MAKKDNGRKTITVKDAQGKSHTVIPGSKADQKYADQRSGITTPPKGDSDKPKGGTTTPPKGGASTPGVAGTGYWSKTGWVQGGNSANDPDYAEMTKKGVTYGVGGKSDTPAPATTPASLYGDTRTETQKLQDQLVKEGYMTQAEVDTGYGIYGPRTTAAVARKNAATPTAPAVTPPAEKTKAELDYDAYVQKPDKTLADQEEVIRQLKEEAARPETDQEARDRITALFQREIDALNAAYAQQKIDATKAGLANLGTNRAQQARFGLLGSSFGAAETSSINQQTEEEKKKIDVSNQAALSPIYNKIAEEVMQSRKDKEKARLTSAEDYLAQLKTAKERKQEIADNAVRNLLLAQADPTDKDLEKMAKQIGIDPSVFKGDYQAAKKEEKANEDKLAKELNKTNADLNMPKDIGDYTYIFNQETGQWDNMGLNKVNTKTQSEQDKAALENARALGAQWLDSVSGGDTFVSPNDYKKAKRDWILTGYPSQEFDKQFISYINKDYVEDYGLDRGTYDSLKRPSLIINN